MFYTYSLHEYFCGYEYVWRCTDMDNNVFYVSSKDRAKISPSSDRIGYESGEKASHRFINEYATLPDGTCVKIKKIEMAEKNPFKQLVKTRGKIKIFRKAEDRDEYFGPSSPYFRGESANYFGPIYNYHPVSGD